jgi:FAD/FMN-containing dehydrogenase
MTNVATETRTWIARLKSELVGRLVTPADADYDQLRMVMAGHVDLHPAAIALVANSDDVAAVVKVARANEIELAVRSGGHDGAGHGSTDGGIVIDLREMKGLQIDPEARTAWAETGLTAGELVAAAAEHGLTIGFGDTGSVGIGGITVGGGIGYLVRKHGLTIDNVLAAEIVTADGELLRVDAQSHPDLFWAIRGGGGNFGVVTRFQYRLHPAETFVGGILVLPATAAAIAGFMAAAASAPEELSTIANVMNCPPMPFVAEGWHGKPVIMAMLGHTGQLAAGEAAMAPFRALAAPVADMLRPMPYPEMFQEEPVPEGGEPYRPKVVGETFFVAQVDEAAGQAMADAIAASDAPMRAVQLRALGGAMARVPADATAFGHRAAKVMVIVVSFYEGTADQPQRAAWVADLSAKLRDGTPGAYVNFLEGDQGIEQAYPSSTLDRLTKIKAKYDPENLFHRNHNISPGL